MKTDNKALHRTATRHSRSSLPPQSSQFQMDRLKSRVVPFLDNRPPAKLQELTEQEFSVSRVGKKPLAMFVSAPDYVGIKNFFHIILQLAGLLLMQTEVSTSRQNMGKLFHPHSLAPWLRGVANADDYDLNADGCADGCAFFPGGRVCHFQGGIRCWQSPA